MSTQEEIEDEERKSDLLAKERGLMNYLKKKKIERVTFAEDCIRRKAYLLDKDISHEEYLKRVKKELKQIKQDRKKG